MKTKKIFVCYNGYSQYLTAVYIHVVNTQSLVLQIFILKLMP